ncbi:ABC-F family ATP-binding cassette domain-containing protein [Candidatus Nucleicultrix amoebiphila]|jgi:ATP-binding cassette subfamily F protein 3|uniref:ABC-F family ATP-binding cassette domain-containing protein n=1 Tax=Candidatus Nucleicultrix amoebiphila TaxID=1509244 RepID=UPI000A26A18D|nr:ABC-F family ATP-binding cassette domain-containing protein [Candidatus Nucleicultrix amoebiphila]
MLHIRNITYRIAGRTLFENTSAHLPKGHKAGLVGRNGTGKSSLFKLIMGEIHVDHGEIEIRKGSRIGVVAQEVNVKGHTPLSFVLSADHERTRLLEQSETETDPLHLVEIHNRLIEIDAYSAPAKASKILVGLGFDEEAQQRPLQEYSGGWRMRVALAAALFSEPDLLLLDEPTNHLDFEATVWLEGFLKNYPQTLLIISHDRQMLNSVADRIYHLHDCRLMLYSGNYDFFEKTRRERLAQEKAEQAKQQERRTHIQEFIDRFRYKASKARQVQSRIKMLEKFDPVISTKDDPTFRLDFPEVEMMPPPMITLEKVSAGYGDKVVLKGLNQRIDPDDRIALLGQNGNGKSTFAKLIAGELAPLSGLITRAPKVRVGYFHQYQIEALRPKESAFEHLEKLLPNLRPDQVRARLGRFGFSRDKADVAVEKLSGGEKSRLNFALVSALEPQILILDEPTNHLDMETRESLIMAINEFKGAVILITHDWHLLELTADRLWLVANQSVKRFDGDLKDYRRFVLSGGKEDAHKSKK